MEDILSYIHNLPIACLLVNFNKHVLQFLYLSSVL